MLNHNVPSWIKNAFVQCTFESFSMVSPIFSRPKYNMLLVICTYLTYILVISLSLYLCTYINIYIQITIHVHIISYRFHLPRRHFHDLHWGVGSCGTCWDDTLLRHFLVAHRLSVVPAPKFGVSFLKESRLLSCYRCHYHMFLLFQGVGVRHTVKVSASPSIAAQEML